ncbi:hypothetical protein BO71DRAFT_481666 [Aspergillus ellipticus CBS 707.79]|uniref:SnoaL-like domain-containing protein n=1 Tax=Aspergillus ellipticus CBS 707.79 TaxID=1448320 RepID=A0A319DHU6_9EURO|nr:hypothetical protein BO71DRAFT_481666 [Aspergillus ellipticus CBS 707.79]
MPPTHTTLTTLVKTYFNHIDAHNPTAASALFSPTATFTIQTEQTTFTGREAIHAMLARFTARVTTMEHRVRSIVADETTGRVATQQYFVGGMSDGTRCDMVNCNFFDVVEVDGEGRIGGVVVWMAGGSSPLV